MRFSTEFIDSIRQQLFQPGSYADRTFRAIADHRRKMHLDRMSHPANPWILSDDQLEYEFQKLGVVFEAVQSFQLREDRLAAIDILKEEYPPYEVEQIVREYFPELAIEAQVEEFHFVRSGAMF